MLSGQNPLSRSESFPASSPEICGWRADGPVLAGDRAPAVGAGAGAAVHGLGPCYLGVWGAFPISRSRAHTHRRHGHPLQTVPSAGLIERPQEKNRVDALR